MLQVIGAGGFVRPDQTVTECQSDWTRLLQSVSQTGPDCYRVSVRLLQSVSQTRPDCYRVSVRLVPNCYRESVTLDLTVTESVSQTGLDHYTERVCQTGPDCYRVSVRLDQTVTECQSD